MRKIMSLIAVVITLLAGLALAQDSTALKPPLPPPARVPVRRFGAGFRISVLDKSSLFLSARPCQWLNLELGGFGSRHRDDWQNTYSYRFQAAADYLLMPGQTVRPFMGLRICWERYRDQSEYDLVTYDDYYGSDYETGTKRRIGLSLGADIDAGRIGLQFGLTPLYDQRTTITRHYSTYSYYGYGATGDTAVTTSSSETAMEYSNFFVAVRVMF